MTIQNKSDQQTNEMKYARTLGGWNKQTKLATREQNHRNLSYINKQCSMDSNRTLCVCTSSASELANEIHTHQKSERYVRTNDHRNKRFKEVIVWLFDNIIIMVIVGTDFFLLLCFCCFFCQFTNPFSVCWILLSLWILCSELFYTHTQTVHHLS